MTIVKPTLADVTFAGATQTNGPLNIRCLDAVTCTTPVLSADWGDRMHRLVEEARRALQSSEPQAPPNHPLRDDIHCLQLIIRDQLVQYSPEAMHADRLYVLEFQGFKVQYTMFGHTTDLRSRVAQHIRDIEPAGVALLNAWASPGVENAQPLEQVALNLGGMIHGRPHYRERFYGMSFKDGLQIARTVFELNTS